MCIVHVPVTTSKSSARRISPHTHAPTCAVYWYYIQNASPSGDFVSTKAQLSKRYIRYTIPPSSSSNPKNRYTDVGTARAYKSAKDININRPRLYLDRYDKKTTFA